MVSFGWSVADVVCGVIGVVFMFLVYAFDCLGFGVVVFVLHVVVVVLSSLTVLSWAPYSVCRFDFRLLRVSAGVCDPAVFRCLVCHRLSLLCTLEFAPMCTSTVPVCRSAL